MECMNIAFDSDDCRLFAQALDHAWEIFLKAGGLTAHNLDTAKASLTYAIFHAARDGERNPRRLAMAAVARMSKFEHVVTQQRMWRQPDIKRAGSF
jgi:hypothetical protein